MPLIPVKKDTKKLARNGLTHTSAFTSGAAASTLAMNEVGPESLDHMSMIALSMTLLVLSAVFIMLSDMIKEQGKNKDDNQSQ